MVSSLTVKNHMKMADLKKHLKEAKNAIKEKDYQTALVYCKAALKINGKSYQALVLFGKVCQELGQLENSKKSLLLASEVEPSQPIAWQGLGALHDKHPQIFDVDQSLLILSELSKVAEPEKLDHILRKKCDILVGLGKHTEAGKTMKELAEISKSPQSIKAAWNTIIQILMPLKENMDHDQNDLLIEALGNIVKEECLVIDNEQNYQLYLKLLYKNGKIEDLVKACQDMTRAFSTAYPLQWMARIYTEAESHIPPQENVLNLLPEIEDTIKTLLEKFPKSPWGHAAQGIISKQSGEAQSATKYFTNATVYSPNHLLFWMLLLESQEAINNLSAVEVTCRKIDEILKSDCVIVPTCLEDLATFCSKTSFKWAKTLVQMGHNSHLKLALSVLDNMQLETKSDDVILFRISVLIKLKDFERASEELANIQNSTKDTETQILEALWCLEQGLDEKALILYEEVLQNEPTNIEALYGLGRFYYESNKEKSLVYLLKAAKVDQKHCGVFSYLARHYKTHGKLATARKCYEQVLRTNPCDDEAGAALSDLYRELELFDENLALLSSMTSGEGMKGGTWAWLRLGLHYLATGDCELAIKFLQGAVQSQPTDSVYYECLGDAYLARGSHSASLRAFTIADNLSSGKSLYARGQIAYIKHLIGEYLESIEEYKKVLDGNPEKATRIVCLVGLAEVLLARAREYQKQQLLANLKEDCLEAIQCLSSVISDCAENVTVWKLLSDACSLQASLPSSLGEFEVPGLLVGQSEQDTVTIDKNKLLTLGCRCLDIAIKHFSTDGSLWHDFGLNLFHLAQYRNEIHSQSQEEYQDLLQRCQTCIKKSLTLNSNDHKAWDSLGVVSFFLGDKSLSVHAFLQSLNIRPTANTWCHLATVLLVNSKLHLAQQAYELGQAVDPGFVDCWVGMAMVAERDDKKNEDEREDKILKILRHTTVLGYETESRLGFANCVMKVACNSAPLRSSVDINKLIPTALDSLVYYTRIHESDPIVMNMLGLAYELMGLKESALHTFEKAQKLVLDETEDSSSLHNVICANRGRSFSNLNRDKEALEAFSSLTEASFSTQCSIALANLKEQKFQDAYESYLGAMHWLDINETEKAYILVALAFLHYKCNVIEEVKTLLFQSSFSANASVEGYAALAALGYLLEDSSLTEAALAEMESHANDPVHAHRIAFLKAAQQMSKENYHQAKIILSRAVRSFPQLAELWRALSFVLVSSPSDGERADSQKMTSAAISTSRACRKMSRQSGQSKDLVLDIVMETLAWLKQTIAQDNTAQKSKGKLADNKMIHRRCIAQAQKAVIMCPDKAETWSVLIAALGKGNALARKFAKIWIPKSPAHLEEWLKLFV